ncbi:hypothetical protein RFI_22978 [Reticulomyxa filosa]|uniref:Uncharacterized protein n=1 Tax=Reticulomyxa filosa TaxID=46433 RepID=X6MLU8_RETFI|nr:hypothetical protein RFI_22978 [Reticulomyxa filosa]|eukprot:ETO14392.1 hypothetical protein RFI_22978 [Reticulomyxa filosa]
MQRTEWQFCRVHDHTLQFGNNTMPIEKKVGTLNEWELRSLKNGFDCDKNKENNDEISLQGLKHLTFAIYTHNNTNNPVYLLWDNYQTAYIWYRFLKMVVSQNGVDYFPAKLITLSKKKKIFDFMSNNSEDDTALVRSIRKRLPHVIKQIDHISQFFCCPFFSSSSFFFKADNIYKTCKDSSYHLSLLSQSNEISSKLAKVTKLVRDVETTSQDKEYKVSELRELWQCLQTDFTACSLKCQFLKAEIEA